MRFFLSFLFFVSCTAFAQVEIENAWARATPPGAKLAAGYMTLRNKSGTADRLVGAASPLARKVETHVTIRDGEILRMREVKGYDVPANGSYELKPGGSHLMLVDIKKPFKDGDKVPLILRFEKAGEVKIELPVRAAAPGGHMDMKMR
ncbi:MAG: copper chaperone PCu(A)C [Terriglobia bacterium]